MGEVIQEGKRTLMLVGKKSTGVQSSRVVAGIVKKTMETVVEVLHKGV